MASIRKRNGKWHVQIRRTVHGSSSRTFAYKTDVLAWARTTEAEPESGRHEAREIAKTTLGELVTRYRNEVVVHKRARDTETRRIDRLLRDPVSTVSLASFSMPLCLPPSATGVPATECAPAATISFLSGMPSTLRAPNGDTHSPSTRSMAFANHRFPPPANDALTRASSQPFEPLAVAVPTNGSSRWRNWRSYIKAEA